MKIFSVFVFCFLIYFPTKVLMGVNFGKETNNTNANLNNIQRIVKNYNDSCIDRGLWTGSVVVYGTLNNGVIFHEAYGHTSICKDLRVSKDAIFDLASVTKPIATATAMAILLDKNNIDTNIPFVKILDNYKGELIEEITIHDLSRHVSGFNNFKPYIETNKVTNHVLNVSPVRSPGKYEYACINFILLGMMVEKISGKSLDEFCNINIFNPLGMIDTKFSPILRFDTTRMVRPIFTPYLGIVSDEPARAAGKPIGNAGLFSTAKDLSRYCLMILQNGYYNNKSVLSSKAVELLTINPKPSESTYTFGWRVRKVEIPSNFSSNTIMHTGWTGQSIWIDLDQKKFVIVLTNRIGDHAQSSIARLKLAELFCEDISKIQ